MVIVLCCTVERAGHRFRNAPRPPLSVSVSPGLTKHRIANLSSISNVPRWKGQGYCTMRLPLKTAVGHVVFLTTAGRESNLPTTSLAILFLTQRIVGCITSLSVYTLCTLGMSLTANR